MTEWFNENELRSYPIRENLSRRTKDGDKVLPNNIIADLSVTIDADNAADVFLSSVGLTPALASIAIGVASEGVLVATIENPEVHRPYRLEPLTDGVSGFVVFGEGVKVSSPQSYDFNPAATGLEGKAVRPFETPPVLSIGKAGVEEEPLHGLINIEVGGDLELRRDGNTLYIGLKEGVRPLYVGPCDRTIDYITCGRPPLREINGVGPDVDGKITIEVQ